MADSDDGHDRPIEELPSADRQFDALRAQIGTRRPALFLDFDCTLTPIVARPDLAALNAEARRVIENLAKHLSVAVVSGRDRADVEELMGIAGLSYAGGHGFDIRTADGRRHRHPVDGHFSEALDRAEARIRKSLANISGAMVERKARSIAIHYRQVDETATPGFHGAVDAVRADEPHLTLMRGKKVVEIGPKIAWDKGKAVLWLLSALGIDGAGHVPIFIGDDVTDEHAFEAIQPDGIGIVVAVPGEDPERRSSASFRVDGPDSVVSLLRRLDAIDWP